VWGMSPSTAISSRCVCCTTALLSVDIFPCFSRRTRWRRRSSVRLSDRQLAQNYLRLFVVGLFLHVRLQRQKRVLLFGVSFVVLCGFAVNVWIEKMLTRHSTQYSEVGAEQKSRCCSRRRVRLSSLSWRTALGRLLYNRSVELCRYVCG
jgi:hypothetical protein